MQPRTRIPEFAELENYKNLGLLTQMQLDLLYRRVNGESYQQIRNVYSISKTTVARAIMRTATCRSWTKGQSGGGMTLLSLPDEMQFKKLVQEMADDLNCITTSMAIAVCTELQNRRLKFAARVLIAARCPHLLAKLDDYCPSPSRGWLNHIATRLSIRIVSSQPIDMLRRSTCDANHISPFFPFLSIDTCPAGESLFRILTRQCCIPNVAIKFFLPAGIAQFALKSLSFHILQGSVPSLQMVQL
ncbi:hypothetical protein TVAG_359400 [Trichomonas vaginalis G3]|uniref:Uncharacterized protein n=1 Tax=Trichomonas vaginalis (strain ATCC PRA-98 / G3) TaxID=412133 RepID=A2DT60_TRIV3|nr:hypothetical protein TVAG_359400 [Trichomonas vaginalis G3]|eukprot:XP_001328555.1 hypothetical protein [Trichomonas vaginalis G3]